MDVRAYASSSIVELEFVDIEDAEVRNTEFCIVDSDVIDIGSSVGMRRRMPPANAVIVDGVLVWGGDS